MEERPPAPRPMMMFGPGMRLWLLITLYFSCIGIFSLLSNSGAMAWLDAGPGDGYPLYLTKLSEVIVAVLIFAVPALVYANVFPAERFRFFRLGRRITIKAGVSGVFAMISAAVAFDLLIRVFSGLVNNPELKEIQEIIEKRYEWSMQMPHAGYFLVCLLVNALVPAVCEELFFRGTFQQVLGEWTKRPHVAILITSVFFTLLHSNIAGLPVIFLAGMMLGYAFYWTGSLRMSILMHFTFNAFSVSNEFANQHIPAWANLQIPDVVCGLSFAVAGGFMYLIWRQSRKTIADA